MNASFFSKVYPRFSKMDKNKCPFLENGLRELKFSYIITFSASALPILLRGCDHYAVDFDVGIGRIVTIMVLWNVCMYV
jgi:hypothetical protein